MACQACRENNKEILKDDTKEPTSGGNKDRYTTLIGGISKTSDVEDFTYTAWTGSATDLIILNLLNEYERIHSTDSSTAKTKDISTSSIGNDKKPALLDPNTVRVGLAFAGHKKF
jgi:hypothetical protein